MALIFGMLLGYGWQSIVTSIALRGICFLIKKLKKISLWILEKAKKIIRFN
jgi:hypothetical protein